MTKLLAVLAASLACWGPKGLVTPVRHPQTVIGTAIFTSYWNWLSTPWFRAGEPTPAFPVLVVIALSGDACIVSGDVWATIQPQTIYACPGRWLRPRP